ncbi:MAG: IS3 family transposase [Candidatus Cloacimonetes bacterium]|nr:IS3 family transposase [Candidatus Cloacimonadota bacterium]
MEEQVRGHGEQSDPKAQGLGVREFETQETSCRKMSGSRSPQGRTLKKMVEPRQKREAVGVVMTHSLSERHACRLVELNRNTKRYQTRIKQENVAIEKFLREKVALPRSQCYGLPRLLVLVRKKFGIVNHKRVERIYRSANLQLARRAKKYVKRTPVPLDKAFAPNQVWAMDFMSDTLQNGRKFRVFNLIDTFSKESVHQIIDSSLQGSRIVRELTQLSEQRRLPQAIICDNGPEFTSKVMLKWADEKGVKLGFIAKGRPTQNGFVESFNGKMRKECLDRDIFRNLVEAKELIMNWVSHYNEERPHRALNFMAPYEFIENYNVKAKCPLQNGL